ncbi:MAG: LptF/LptG family permease [Pyrinomonadaceae bacterium]|nr:LptF/LptG family permease [Pyrinomonadaceae bacterium]
MNRAGWLISKYIIQSILPYFLSSWLLLTVVLFVQQASRYSDIFFSINLPSNLTWQLTIALIPNVIAFTSPMAVLLGVIIGLSKMQGDSELVAIRTAGVGSLQIALPIIILGLLLSGFALLINVKGVPIAAQVVRAVAVRAALFKLESPIEPGVFNKEINGLTIYVKKGNLESGNWENVFIFQEDKQNGQMRLITSTNGRIDSTDETSELILDNAFVNTISLKDDKQKLVSESLGQIRLAIKTRRNEIVERLAKTESTPDELGLSELAAYAGTQTGAERTEALVLWQRRILLSITPLIFALLGTGLVLRYNRGGKGFGVFLGLVSLVGYYLISLLSEQLARTNYINVFLAGLLPLAASVTAISWLFLSNRFFLRGSRRSSFKLPDWNIGGRFRSFFRSNYYPDFAGGILDIDIVRSLLKYLFLTVVFLTSIYLIFTAFELWKFAGTIENGVFLLTKYLIYLIPFVYIQLAPSALMIAILATYVIKSRQNEIVTWTASGQSIYRLLAPCFALMIVIGFVNWGIQETIAPVANLTQDQLRVLIRDRGVQKTRNDKLWVANNNRVFSFNLGENSTTGTTKVRDLMIFEYATDRSKLESIYRIPAAEWSGQEIHVEGNATKLVYTGDDVEELDLSNGKIPVEINPFGSTTQKPSHLNSSETRNQIAARESEVERRMFRIALEKKNLTLVLPLVVMLFTAPFALSLSRKGKAATVGYAVGIWLLFMGTSNVFEQFGQNGFLSPFIAVWSPAILFGIIGAYLLSKVKT